MSTLHSTVAHHSLNGISTVTQRSLNGHALTDLFCTSTAACCFRLYGLGVASLFVAGEGGVQQDPARARGPVDEVLQQRARRHEGFQPHARGQGRSRGAPGLCPGPRRAVCQGIKCLLLYVYNTCFFFRSLRFGGILLADALRRARVCACFVYMRVLCVVMCVYIHFARKAVLVIGVDAQASVSR